jgi:hypothetical protein
VHQLLTLKSSICSFRFGAQYSPLLACPLLEWFLMQVHKLAEAAQRLARQGANNSGFCKKNHVVLKGMVIFNDKKKIALSLLAILLTL